MLTLLAKVYEPVETEKGKTLRVKTFKEENVTHLRIEDRKVTVSRWDDELWTEDVSDIMELAAHSFDSPTMEELESKIYRQRAANRKLQRKYNIVKGVLNKRSFLWRLSRRMRGWLR